MTHWQVQLEEVEGELVLPLPQELLDLVGWQPGSVLQWIDRHDGSFVLQLAEPRG